MTENNNILAMPSSQPAAGMLAVKPEYLSSQSSSAAKTSEPNRNKSYDPRKPHITDQAMTKSNWYKHVNWLNVALIVGIPLYGCIQAFWTPLRWQTAIFAVLYYFMTGLGITAGKHLTLYGFLCHQDQLLTCFLNRLSPPLGPHLLLCNPPPPHFSRCSRRWCRRGFRPLVGPRPSSSPPLHRH